MRVKLPQVMDAEDVGVMLTAAVYAIGATATIVGLAAALGLAWTVFRMTGGL